MASKCAARGSEDFQINNILPGKSSRYKIKKFVGEGLFGKVAQCIKLGTEEKMAVKIVQKTFTSAGKREVDMLEILKTFGKDKNNLVKFTEHFMHQGHVCLVFEMLDMSLEDLMMIRHYKPLRLPEIRGIAQQLLVALNALKSINVVHADIKPENVMLVNHELQPFKVKLIDFGLATPVSRLWRGKTIQVVSYRAPEVILGLQLSEAVDMWSLGCVLAYLYLGNDLFPTNCEYEVMRTIVLMLGQPNDQLLNSGIHTRYHFSKDQASPGAPWRLKGQQPSWTMFNSLDDMVMTYTRAKDVIEDEDTLTILSLLKRMLHVDPENRITPREALEHRFITMKHFHSNSNSSSLDGPLPADDETDVDTNTRPPAKAGLNQDFQINNIMCGKLSRYQIEKFVGKGGFGKVAQCIKLGTEEKMAVKIVRKTFTSAGKREVDMLENLKNFDKDKNNLVKFTEHFMHQGHVCLVFEMLDISLHDLIKMMMMRCLKPLHLPEIRGIAQQLLVALNALKSINVVHADIKPDNVMLVNHELQPFKVKLIDFGLASPVSRLWRGKTIQAVSYRAPEVILGLKLNEAVDMWSLGCILAYLYLGKHLFPSNCEYRVMRAIVLMLGQPNDQLLNSGIHTRYHFSKDQASPGAPWRLKGHKPSRAMFTSLDDMVKTHRGAKDDIEDEDTLDFLSLLKRMLHVDPENRITPREALEHRFITMKHFHSNSNSSSLDGPLPADDETDVDNNNGPPVKAGLDDTTAAGLNHRTGAIADRVAADNNNGPPATVGVDGTTNNNGPPATVGVDGTTNNNGPPATVGVDGTTNNNGPPATVGVDGTTNNNGPPATVGVDGTTNNNGPPATVGVNGTTNNNGPPATVGVDGTTNNNGPPATVGVDGTTNNNGPPATVGVDGTTNNNGPPATVGVDETTTAGTDKNLPAASPSSLNHTTGFVEVKTRYKWFKRIRRFFSRIKFGNCCCRCY